MAKTKKSKRQEPHPTLFVWQGAIKHYEDGSMLELHTQLSLDDWQRIVVETVQYKVFLDCLKTVAFPILREQWTAHEDWFRVQLEVAISRMHNIDPLYVNTINQEDLKTAYTEKMRQNATTMTASIEMIKKMDHHGGDRSQITVSDL